MIQLLNVTKTYPPASPALVDITLRIDKGQFVFLAGPSGAGKTTLLKLLFREEELTRGQIFIDNQNINRLHTRGVARLRRRIGLVFQEFRLLPWLTVMENVALAAQVVGVPRREAHIKALRLLKDLGLEKSHAKPLMLSGGEQQRVAIARALINDPMLILADEPTGNLDSAVAEETMRIFLKLREAGTTLIVASHNLDLIKRYGSRIISLRQGRLVDDLERVSEAQAS
jgi:cell division transport system ATP-binding protein